MRRCLVVGVLLASPSAALANSAMGLGLERWDLAYWYAYVLVMVVAEAWLIGRWLELSWAKSVGLSLAANAVTGLCGGVGCIAPFLHNSFAGSRLNPNPLLDSISVLTYFAIPSAVIEYLVWSTAKEAAGKPRKLWRVVWVHLALVPVGLAIVLIPDRPYRTLEGFTAYQRRMTLHSLEHSMKSYIETKAQVPTGRTPEELIAELRPLAGEQTLFFQSLERPVFHRFSTGETPKPFQINSDLTGKKISEPNENQPEKWVWFIRPQVQTDYSRQIEVEVHSGAVRNSIWEEGKRPKD